METGYSRRARLRLAVLAFVASVAVALLPAALNPAPAQAISTSGFSAGNIIDDTLFYNGGAMSASEIQVFLNQKLATCKIGTPPYMPGWPSPSGTGNTIASNCLKGFRQTTSSRAADRYCQGYAGAPNESAAQIISKVARSCSISPKVLLVMLEKEQSLVTDSWPVTRQYNYALGMNCPDSGPNNSANCDAESAGFSVQLYLGARQLQVYKGNPGSFNFSPGHYNTIQWHPNSGCGTSQVYIENWATASLYIYTPYRPNQAALDAGWGTGDGCSSYGNRNFYLFYTSWFGSTRGFNVWGDIGAYWNARGGAGSIFGYPVDNSTFYTTRFAGGAWAQNFSGGVIITEMNTGKTVGIPFGPVYRHLNEDMGGLFGVMGAPIAEPQAYTENGGATLQLFQGGTIISAVKEGTVASIPYDKVFDLYNGQLGGIYGPLGYPVSNFLKYPGGKLQNFQKGFISQADGESQLVNMVQGPFYTAYGAAGGIYGRLGFPITSVAPDGTGRSFQEYKKGLLFTDASGQVAELSGSIYDFYLAAKLRGEPLGMPASGKKTTAVNGGAEFQEFGAGVVVTPKATGKAASVSGKIFQHYSTTLGGFGGSYGYPTGEAWALTNNGGGRIQAFQRGYVITSDSAGTVAGILNDTAIQRYYNTQMGGVYGSLGLPTSDEVANADGSRAQQFQNGVIVLDSRGRVSSMPLLSYQHYIANGGPDGVLGSQTAATIKFSEGGGLWLSFFKNGEILQGIRDNTVAIVRYDSPIYDYYNTTTVGGIYGWLGLPTGDEIAQADGTKSQAFQGGIISLSPAGVVTAMPTLSLEVYSAAGGAGGALGVQIAAPRKFAEGGGLLLTAFKNGEILQSVRNGTAAVVLYNSPIYAYYNTTTVGGIYGSLGLPIASEVINADGSRSQRFQNGTVSVSAAGAVTVQR